MSPYRLNVTNCESITDRVLEQLAVHSSALEALVLTRCTHVTDQGIASLTALQQLKYLILFHVDNISDKGTVPKLSAELFQTN